MSRSKYEKLWNWELLKKTLKKLGDFESLFDIKNKPASEILLKTKIEQEEVNQVIYILDNTLEILHYEDSKTVENNQNNLIELDESNTSLIINGKTEPFKK